MKRNDFHWNMTVYSAKEALYSAAVPMINGALIQLFLTNRGVSASQVGLFNTVIYIVTLAASTLLSGTADKRSDPMGFAANILLIQAILYAAMLPIALCSLEPMYILVLITLVASVQTVLYSCKSVLEYKIPYQIIAPEKYTQLSSFSGIAIGIVGIVFSTIFSKLIEFNVFGNPYLICMILSLFLLLASFLACRNLRPVNHIFDSAEKSRSSAAEILATLRSPIFLEFLVPNTLRGVSFGITNCIAMVALAMGLDEISASRLPIMCSLGYVLGSWLFERLCRNLKVPVVGLIGGALLSIIIFLPSGNSTLFLILFFIAYTGRILVDWSVPVMVFHMIDPAIAGAYNAWRNILLNLSSTIAVYLTGILLETAHPLWVLIPCGIAYLISMIWYQILYKKMLREPQASRA